MGTNIYGSYDELVIELSGLDLVRAGRREVRVRVDDVWHVRAADPRTLVRWEGERLLRVGRRRGTEPVLVLDLGPDAAFDRIVVGLDDAEQLAADLHRSGIGTGVGGGDRSGAVTPVTRQLVGA